MTLLWMMYKTGFVLLIGEKIVGQVMTSVP
jgi:hypothetical protein